MELKINGCVNDTIVDGPGIRYAIYTQGCHHACEGCHNPDTHDLEGGSVTTVETLLATIDANPLLSGITLSGGEPFLQPEPLALLAAEAHKRKLTVWAYSGYTFEELLTDETARPLLEQLDVLVDGRFELAQRSLSLKWRGSSNQRVLDVPASLNAGHAVELA